MVKRPMQTPPSSAARFDGNVTAPPAGVPQNGGNGGDDQSGPMLQAGWKVFGGVPRAWTIVTLAVGAWLVLALVALGVFGLFT